MGRCAHDPGVGEGHPGLAGPRRIIFGGSAAPGLRAIGSSLRPSMDITKSCPDLDLGNAWRLGNHHIVLAFSVEFLFLPAAHHSATVMCCAGHWREQHFASLRRSSSLCKRHGRTACIASFPSPLEISLRENHSRPSEGFSDARAIGAGGSCSSAGCR